MKNVRLHIWSRKEIENYFLLPGPIVRAIRKRMPARATAPKETEIEAQLEAICDTLKADVFDAIAAEFLAEDRALGAGGANKAARKALDAEWQTLDGRLRTVSGKQVFAALSHWSQEQFGVPLSAAIVARECMATDIVDEMRGVLTAIQEGQDFGDGRNGNGQTGASQVDE
jgi:hypothetical protein